MTALSHCLFKPNFSEMSQFVTHHGGDDFGFSACVSYASGMWGSYGPYMSRIGRWLNPSIVTFSLKKGVKRQ